MINYIWGAFQVFAYSTTATAGASCLGRTSRRIYVEQ